MVLILQAKEQEQPNPLILAFKMSGNIDKPRPGALARKSMDNKSRRNSAEKNPLSVSRRPTLELEGGEPEFALQVCIAFFLDITHSIFCQCQSSALTSC